MQDVIRLLPDNVANQIAAGEVVQRPASVVKELLENAIDAQASQIHLNVKEAGRNLIQVIDNGVGMSVTDARMAFERHSTSKIYEAADIYQIKTKGFRGEALASIAAVSQVDLRSRRVEDEMGTHLIIEANEVKSQTPDLAAQGSNFSVKNLFYNVPARRKFLKSNHVELRHIVDEFLRVALTHSNIEFQLTHNDKEIYRLRTQKRVQRIVEVFGNKIKSNLVPIEIDLDWIQIKGYIGKPESAKKKRGEQYFFVNNRFFRSAYFNRAVLDAYEGLLPNGYTPSYFIYFTIDPDKIDVNIHPSKTEIKFENESDLYALLRSSLKQSIGVYNVAPSLDFEQKPEWHGDRTQTQSGTTTLKAPKIHVNPAFNPFEIGKNRAPNPQEKIEIGTLYESSLSALPKEEELELHSDQTPLMRLQNGTWLWEKDQKLYALHPFRVHQAVLYERLRKQITDKVLSQQLLFPIEFPIDERQKVLLSSVEKNLMKLGFELEYSSEFLTLQAIPTELISENMMNLFDALFEELDRHQDEKFLEYFYQKAAYVSAKSKDRWVNPQEMRALLQQFEALGKPPYSPSKKRTYTTVSMLEISKLLEL